MTASLIIQVVVSNGFSSRTISVTGRDAWALGELVKAGSNGCTPITHPGPRWSAYVFNLRRKCGLNIETITETHQGPFPGSHARYVLRSQVEIIEFARAA